jgi:hypothetical protein
LPGLTSVPFDAGEFDDEEPGDELDVPGLALVDVDAGVLALGVAVLVGWGLALSLTQGVPVAVAVVLPALFAALLLAVAEADVLALFVGLLVASAVAVAVALLVALLLLLGLALLLLAAGLLLVLPLAGLVTEPGEGTLGVADLPALAEWDGAGVGEHTAGLALLGPTAVLPWLRPPAAAPAGLPGPAWLGVPAVLREVIPADWLSWTRAWRIGGTARATPMANKAQAIARVGRSSPSRQSRGWRRACPAPVPRARDDPPVPEPCGAVRPAASCPSRLVFQRRTSPARNPPAAAPAAAPLCWLA